MAALTGASILTSYILLPTFQPACAYSGLAHIALLSDNQDIYVTENWAIAGFSLSLATQAIATSMIVFKLWCRSSRQVPAMHRQYVFVTIVIIESGIVLTTISAIILTLTALQNNAAGMLEPIMNQLSVCVFIVQSLDTCLLLHKCLVPTSIIVRAGMKKHSASMRTSSSLQAYNGNNVMLVQTPPVGQTSAVSVL